LYYYWLKAKSQNPLLINRPSNQRDLPEAELARRIKVRTERQPLPAGDVLEAADLLRIIQAYPDKDFRARGVNSRLTRRDITKRNR
jgi:hypothetical protein